MILILVKIRNEKDENNDNASIGENLTSFYG
jgi:hypothetical protein